MRRIFTVVLFLAMSSAFAGQITRIECSAAPRWVQFELSLNQEKGTFSGVGVEDYVDLNFECEKSLRGREIVCESQGPTSDKQVNVIITMDKENIVTARYNGIYHRDLKMGCIAGM